MELPITRILDLPGLVINSLCSGVDPDADLLPDGTLLPTVGHGVGVFLDKHLIPGLSLTPLNFHIAVMDGGHAYRSALYKEYKAHRKEVALPVTLRRKETVEACKRVVTSLGIPVVTLPEQEGDDTVAHFVVKWPGKKVVETVDYDLLALASEDTLILVNGQPKYGWAKQDYTVKPEHLTLYKSIVGDSSDGYGGVTGCGIRFWEKLVAEYGDSGLAELEDSVASKKLTAVRDAITQQPGQHPLLERLYENQRQWIISYQLARLHPELVDGLFKGKFNRLKWLKRLPDRDKLTQLLRETGNLHYLSKLEPLLPQQTLIVASDWDETVPAEFAALCAKSRFIALDWETSAPYHEPFQKAATGEYVDMLGSTIAGMGVTLGYNLEHTFYFSFDHADRENNLGKDKLVALLRAIPADLPVVAQNAYFEMSVLKAELGLEFPLIYDTKIMASHVDEVNSNGLKDLSKRWLNYDQIKYRDVVPLGMTMQDITSEQVFKYGADDAIVTAHLFDLFYLMMNLEGTWAFCRDNEFDALRVWVDAYLAGVSLDWDEVSRQHAEDLATYEANLARCRALLKENQDEAQLSAGTANLLEEFQLNFDGETHYYERLIKESKGKAWKSIKSLEKAIGDRLIDESPLDEILEVFHDERAKERLNLVAKAQEAATYQDYAPVPYPVKFEWNPAHLARAAMNAGSDEAKAHADIASLQDVPEDKRKNRVAYKRLRDWFNMNPLTEDKLEGFEFNINSPIQMQNLLYGMLALPIRVRAFEPSDSRKARGLPGTPQTNKDALRAAMAEDALEGTWKRELLALLLEAKHADTRVKLYYNKFPLWKHPKDGLIHPMFNSVGTETRRPSGSSPNLLQLSKKGEGVKIRACIQPNQKLGHDLVVSIDFDSQEIRAQAGLSKDENLLSCFIGTNKRNVHSLTGAFMASLGAEQVAYETFLERLKSDEKEVSAQYKGIRGQAKSVNFLSSYGGGPAKLARDLLCSLETAKEFLQAKRDAYPGYENWRSQTIASLHQQGYVQTLFGSRKHVFDSLRIKEDEDEGLVGYYERSSVNYMIQGVCADYLKRVLADMHRLQILPRRKAVLIAAIYDELVFSVHSSNAVGLIKDAYEVMTQGIPGLGVPMLANPSLGVNFRDQIEVLEDCDDPLTDDKILKAIGKALGRLPSKEAA